MDAVRIAAVGPTTYVVPFAAVAGIVNVLVQSPELSSVVVAF
ncbi:MAG: hypothetical protein ACLP0J_16720 [Solirubrobacteraceae bacterium]